MIIYCSTAPNNKCYVGQTIKRFNSRKNDHMYKASRWSMLAFHQALRKYGYENFKWEILDTANSFDELNEKEIFWIKEKRSRDYRFGYNRMDGGRLFSTHSKESKAKMSKSQKGRKTQEHVKLLFKDIYRGSGNPFFGKKHDEETRKRMSAGRKGWVPSDEYKIKMAKIMGAIEFDVYKDGIFVGHWGSYSSCARELKLTVSHVSECVVGKAKQHKGYNFLKGEHRCQLRSKLSNH